MFRRNFLNNINDNIDKIFFLFLNIDLNMGMTERVHFITSTENNQNKNQSKKFENVIKTFVAVAKQNSNSYVIKGTYYCFLF